MSKTKPRAKAGDDDAAEIAQRLAAPDGQEHTPAPLQTAQERKAAETAGECFCGLCLDGSCFCLEATAHTPRRMGRTRKDATASKRQEAERGASRRAGNVRRGDQ